MGSLATDLALDLDGFLDWEERQAERFERVDGVVRMISGGTAAHDRIAGNLYIALRTELRGKGGCNVHLSNLKVVARQVGSVMYPDLFVRCGGLLQQEVSTDDPVVVFEVLTTSTAQYDLTRKKYAYQSMPSVRAIVFVSQREAWVDIVRRTEHGWADGYVEGMEAVLELPEINVSVPLAEIYEDVAFEPAPSED
jgi:Uma2 family endonuclease